MQSEEMVYPPSTFLLIAPLGRAGWPRSAVLWCWLGVALYALACAALVEEMQLESHPIVLLPLLALVVSMPFHAMTAMPFNSVLHTANPTLVAVPLVTLACLLLLSRGAGQFDVRIDASRRSLGWVLLGLALALKPQIAIGALVALLTQKRVRKDAIKAAGLAIAILAVATVLFRLRLGSFDFLKQFVINNRVALQPGHSSDLSMISRAGGSQLGLQRAAYFFGAQRPWPDVFAWSVVALLVLCAVLVQKRNGVWHRLIWCSVAFCVLLSLMPVYHGKYDRLLLLAALPAIAELHSHGHRAAAWLLAIIGAFWPASEEIFDHILGRAEKWPVNQAIPVLLCALLLWAMARQARGVPTQEVSEQIETGNLQATRA